MRHLVISLTVLCVCTNNQAATFTVDTTSDVSLSVCSATADDCSLRGAITAANTTTAPDTIAFNIPNTDVGFQPTTQHWRISVGATALPAISEPVLIDGYTQSGAIANTNTPVQGGFNGTLKIELVPGSSFGTQQNGLDTFTNNFAAAASTIRGLVISRFASQIQLGGSSAHRVEGCYLGTDITGNAAAVTNNSARGNGVRLQGPGAYQIGGNQPEQRNLISGMFSAVVQQTTLGAVVIRGNLIGTNAAGTQAIGNNSSALELSVGILRNVTIGGADPLDRNVISGSSFSAISLFGQGVEPFQGTRIEGNYIGTDWSGTRALGNGLNLTSPSQVTSTIRIIGIVACNLTIGGASPGQANLIAYSGKQGVENDQCRGIQAADNIFVGNRDTAFDNVVGGGAQGATPNDPNDADNDLGNRGQNYPELSLGSPNLGMVRYRVDSAIANASYPLTVNFFRAGCGGGAAQRVASASISAAQAQQLQSIDLTALSFLPLTAVAIDAAGNQSEFAPALGEEIFRQGFEDVLAAGGAGICR